MISVTVKVIQYTMTNENKPPYSITDINCQASKEKSCSTVSSTDTPNSYPTPKQIVKCGRRTKA